MNYTITEMKNIPGGINSRIIEAEAQISWVESELPPQIGRNH